MLSPAKTDPNCKKEEERKKANPADFGNFNGNEKPKNFKHNVGLKKASTDVEEKADDTKADDTKAAKATSK